jgi:hypothetical protein
MNKSLFLLVFVIVVFILCLYDIMSNKNKFRVALLFDGIFNKIVILAIIVLVLMEDIRIGIMLFLTFFVAHLRLQNTENLLIEGFEDYYSNN